MDAERERETHIDVLRTEFQFSSDGEMRRYKHIGDVTKLMWEPTQIRNIGIVAHVDISW
jgi:hypothetical protein